jgi:GNAT superfamily N-acetyltransferase
MTQAWISHYQAHLKGLPINPGNLALALQERAGTWRMEADGLWALVAESPWDTRVLGRRTWRLVAIGGQGGEHGDRSGIGLEPMLDRLQARAGAEGVEFMVARLGAPLLPLAPAFEGRGWRLADMLVCFLDRPAPTAVGGIGAGAIRPLTPGDADAVIALAGMVAWPGRVENDDRLPRAARQAFHREMAASLGHRLRAGELFGVGIGGAGALEAMALGSHDALASRLSGQACGVLDFVATAPSASGRGLGGAVLHAFRHSCAVLGLEAVEISTQIQNHAALALYEGLRVAGGLFSFHWHAR